MRKLLLFAVSICSPSWGAVQSLVGQGMWYPSPSQYVTSGVSNALVIDATGEKIAFCGKYWNKDHAQKDVTRLGFLFGAVTTAGGSALTVSLQDVSAAAGQPMQPDGTGDQTVAVANGDIATGWYRTGALNANRTLNPGDYVCAVIEYDGSGRLGADSVIVQGMTPASTGPLGISASSLYTSSWAASLTTPNIVFEDTGGDFGTLEGAYVYSATGLQSSNSGSATDEYALEFTLPGPVKIDAVGAYVRVDNAAADFEIDLYAAATTSSAIDATFYPTLNSLRYVQVALASEVSLAKATTYYISLKPTAAQNIEFTYIDVADVKHWQCHPGSSDVHMVSRVDGGAWGDTTTRRPFWIGVRISAIDDGVGGGGGSFSWVQ